MIEPTILAAIEARLRSARALPPGNYRPFVVAGVPIGRIDDVRATRLAAFDVFTIGDEVRLEPRLHDAGARTAVLADVAAALRRDGELPAWRDESFAIAARFGEAPLFTIERGAARYFGLATYAVHVSGVVPGADARAPRIWFARRSATKAVDPGLLDNLVAGGVAAGYRLDETLVKEACEEAGIPAALARTARPAGIVHAVKPMFDGLQRELLFVHDLALPRDFVPANQDGEAVEHRLVDLSEAAATIAATHGPNETTPAASLVVLDYLIRHGHVAADDPLYVRLDALLHTRIEA